MPRTSKPRRSSVLVLHGPNLNLLGTREPAIYGRESLADINRRLVTEGRRKGLAVTTFQSNHEGALVDRIQTARKEGAAFIVINPGAYTHTSVAIRDALAAVAIPSRFSARARTSTVDSSTASCASTLADIKTR